MENTTQTLHSNYTAEDGNTKASSADSKRYRNWFFTLNNYTTEDIVCTENTLISIKSNYVFQEETGKSGTPHLQGSIFLKNGKTFEAMKNLLPNKIHLEIIRNKKSAGAYCCKEETRTGNIYTNIKKHKPITDPLKDKPLYRWEKDILELINNNPDPRKIYWYYEPKGNTGKTSFCKHLCINRKDAIYLDGKSADMKYAIAMAIEEGNIPTLILMDLTRSREEYISYEALESIKNGIFFNGKYKGKMVLFDNPHVIVFANFPPEEFKLSQDRWVIRNISLESVGECEQSSQ